MLDHELGLEALIRALGHVDLLVDHGKDASGLELQQVQTRLVVREGDVLHGDTLAGVLVLFELEDVLVEVELRDDRRRRHVLLDNHTQQTSHTTQRLRAKNNVAAPAASRYSS